MDAHRVVGGDRAVEEGPARARRRSGRAGARTSAAPATSARISCSWRDEVGLRADGSEHRASGGECVRIRNRVRTGVRVSYPRCTTRRSRGRGRRSPFVAAFLSLLFPGLGHAYAGAYQRALGFAAPPILARRPRRRDRPPDEPVGARRRSLLTPWVLPGSSILNLALLVYRLVAIVDAYRVDGLPQRARGERRRAARAGRGAVVDPLSLAGLCAVAPRDERRPRRGRPLRPAGLSSADRPASSIRRAPNGCDQPDAPVRRRRRLAGADRRPDRHSPTGDRLGPPVQGSDLPDATIPPWDGKDRLNILLIGADQRPGDGTYNTDTMIVGLDRPDDEAGRDVQPAARHRSTCRCRRARRERLRRRLSRQDQLPVDGARSRGRTSFPGNERTRGYNALKAVLGNLYGLDIKYYVEVNFDGFKKVVDALGGVTINVQIPVLDDHYPGDARPPARVYIPAGIQHMTGAAGPRVRALAPRLGRLRPRRPPAARPRLAARAGRRRDADPAASPTSSRRSRRPSHRHPADELAAAAPGSPSTVDTPIIRSYVFSPRRYGRRPSPERPRGYIIEPNVNRIRPPSRTRSRSIPARGGPRRRSPRGRRGLGPQRLRPDRPGGDARGLPRVPTGSDATAPNQKPDTTGLDGDHGSSSTTAPRTTFPLTIGRICSRRSDVTVVLGRPTRRPGSTSSSSPPRSTPDLTPPPAP